MRGEKIAGIDKVSLAWVNDMDTNDPKKLRFLNETPLFVDCIKFVPCAKRFNR